MDDLKDRGLPASIVAALACILAIVLFSAYLATTPSEPEPTYTINLDCNNSALMHEYGLPTKADVMQWHVTGYWSYQLDGDVHTYWELPGRSATWDTLYRIDQNPTFKK